MKLIPEWRVYYTMPQIAFHSGKWETQRLAAAQQFLEELLVSDDSVLSDSPSESLLQACLWMLCQSESIDARAHAALNFRCLIGNTARKALDGLVHQLGDQFGWAPAQKSELRRDLYPCVLDDNGNLWGYQLIHQSDSDDEGKPMPLRFARDQRDRLLGVNEQGVQSTTHMAFSFQVLESFAPDRSNHQSLKNWTVRLVKQHQEVKAVLRDYGIYRCQPWRFLSRMSSAQFRRIAEQNASLSPTVVDYQVKLLQVLHEVHRDRTAMPTFQTQRQRKQWKLEQMLVRLRAAQIHLPSVEVLTDELKTMMNEVLKYRQQVAQPQSMDGWSNQAGERQEWQSIISCDAPTGLEALERQLLGNLHQHICQNFYPVYKQRQLELLDQAIDASIQRRYTYLQKRHGVQRAKQYLEALRAFFVDQKSMQMIAHQLGLKGQSQVSRLLQLSTQRRRQTHTSPDLLTTCMIGLAHLLRELFLVWAQQHTTPEEFQLVTDQPELLWTLLETPIQEITHIFQQASAEISRPQRAEPGLFAQRVGVVLNQYPH